MFAGVSRREVQNSKVFPSHCSDFPVKLIRLPAATKCNGGVAQLQMLLCSIPTISLISPFPNNPIHTEDNKKQKKKTDFEFFVES